MIWISKNWERGWCLNINLSSSKLIAERCKPIILFWFYLVCFWGQFWWCFTLSMSRLFLVGGNLLGKSWLLISLPNAFLLLCLFVNIVVSRLRFMSKWLCRFLVIVYIYFLIIFTEQTTHNWQCNKSWSGLLMYILFVFCHNLLQRRILSENTSPLTSISCFLCNGWNNTSISFWIFMKRLIATRIIFYFV